MDKQSKKDLQAQYKEREIVGGVFIIKNTLKNKVYLDATLNLSAAKNRFELTSTMGSGVLNPKLQKDWSEQSGEGFVMEILDELKKSDTQTEDEFKADIKIIKQMWEEKLSGEVMY